MPNTTNSFGAVESAPVDRARSRGVAVSTGSAVVGPLEPSHVLRAMVCRRLGRRFDPSSWVVQHRREVVRRVEAVRGSWKAPIHWRNARSDDE